MHFAASQLRRRKKKLLFSAVGYFTISLFLSYICDMLQFENEISISIWYQIPNFFYCYTFLLVHNVIVSLMAFFFFSLIFYFFFLMTTKSLSNQDDDRDRLQWWQASFTKAGVDGWLMKWFTFEPKLKAHFNLFSFDWMRF